MDDEQLKLVIEAQAQIQAALREVQGGLRGMLDQVKAFNRESQQAAKTAQASWRQFGGQLQGVLGVGKTVFGALNIILGTALHWIRRLVGAVFDLARAIGGALWNAVERVFGYLRMAAVAGVLALSGAMALLARQGLAVNASFQETEIGLRTLLGSARAASDLMAQMRTYATRSTAEFVDIARWSKQLIAFGFSAREVLPTLEAVGDAVAGVGGGAPKVQQLLIALGQMRAKGKVSGEEVLQLAEAGIDVRKYLGVREGQDVGTMNIPATVGIPKIVAGMGREFGGLQQQAAQTWSGIFSAIKDQVNYLSAAITEGLYGSLEKAGAALRDFLAGLRETEAGKAIVAGLQTAFSAVGDALVALAGKLPAAAEWLARFLNPEAVGEFVGRAWEWFQWLRERVGEALEWIGANWGRIWEGAKAVVHTVIREVGAVVGGLVGVIQYLLEGTSTGVQGLGERLREFAAGAVETLGKVATAVAATASLFSGLAEAIIVAVAALSPGVRREFGGFAGIRKGFAEQRQAYKEWAQQAVQASKEAAGVIRLIGAGEGGLAQAMEAGGARGAYAAGARAWQTQFEGAWGGFFRGPTAGEEDYRPSPEGRKPYMPPEAPPKRPAPPERPAGPTPQERLRELAAQIDYAQQVMKAQPWQAEEIRRTLLAPALKQQIALLQQEATGAKGAERWELLGQLAAARQQAQESAWPKAVDLGRRTLGAAQAQAADIWSPFSEVTPAREAAAARREAEESAWPKAIDLGQTALGAAQAQAAAIWSTFSEVTPAREVAAARREAEESAWPKAIDLGRMALGAAQAQAAAIWSRFSQVTPAGEAAAAPVAMAAPSVVSAAAPAAAPAGGPPGGIFVMVGPINVACDVAGAPGKVAEIVERVLQEKLVQHLGMWGE